MREKLPIIGLLLAFGGLAAYLFSPAPLDGDGAAYMLQGIAGSPWERSVHVGVLAALWAWSQAFGLDAANASSILWAAAALVGVERLSASLAPNASPIERLLAPLILLGAAASWRAALFVEVYGPLATLAVWAAVALRSDHVLAGPLLGWMVLVHPGAVALLPGVVLIGGRLPGRRSLLLGVAVPFAAWALLWPAPWSGPRGVAALPAFDVSPPQSLQRAWRMLARDLGVSAVALVLAAGVAIGRDRRALIGVLAVVSGSALAVDRYADNAGQLPALWLLSGFAPLALRWRPSWTSRPAFALGLALLAALGVAEATSHHDLVRRHAERSLLTESTRCGEETSDWGQQMRRDLACREWATQAAEAPTAP